MIINFPWDRTRQLYIDMRDELVAWREEAIANNEWCMDCNWRKDSNRCPHYKEL